MTLIRTSPSGPNVEVDAPVDLGPNTIYGNPTAAPAVGVDIPLGLNTVLGRVAGNIVAAQLVTSQIALNQVTNAVLAQGAALTVKANPTGALADFQDVAAAADNTVFRRVGGVLDFGPLTSGMIPAGIFPLSSIEPIAANTVVANATAGLASPTAVAVGTNTVLGRVAGNIVAAQIVTAQIGASQVTNAELAPMDARTVKVNATAAPTNPQDLVVGMNSVVGRVGGNIIAAQIVTAQIALNQVDNTILAQMASNTVKVNATALLADPQDLAVGLNTVLGRVGGNIIAAQLVTAQIAVNQVTNPVLAQMAALTVKANATNALADPQDLAAGSNDTLLRRTGDALSFGTLTPGMIPSAIIPLSAIEQLAANTVVANATAGLASPTAVPVGLGTVLGRVAGNIVAAQVVTAQIALNQVTNAVLAQMAANTVKVNATAALADPQDLAVGANTVLGRVAGNIVAAQLVDAQITNATISLPKLATAAANTVLANATAGVASPTAVAVGTNTVLGRVAGNIVAAQVVTAQIALNQVTNAVLAQMAANTVKVNATAALADPQDLAVGTNTVLGRVAGNIVAAQLVDAQITNATISLPKLATQAANTVLANATAGVASPTAVAVGTNTVLGRVAGNIVAAQLVTAQIAVNQVTNAVLAQMAALTVKANATNALANAADLAAGANDTLLRRTADTLNFGALTPGMIPSAIIPLSAIEAIAANTVVANATAGLASPTAVAVGTNTVLGRVAGNIVAAQVVTAQIAVNQVTNAVLAQMAANTVKVNATAALADPQDLAVGANTVLGRVAGNIVAAQLVNAQVTGGGLATLKGVAINGVAGTLQDVTQAQLSDLFRVVNGVTDVLAPGTFNDYVVAETTKLLRININADGDVEITGFALGSSNTGGWIRLFNQATSTIRRIVLRHSTGSALGNQLVLPGNTDFILDHFGDALDLQYIGGRWQIIQKLLSTTQIPDGTVTLPKLATQAANTVVANATASVASPTAVAVGTNTVLGRVAGNIVAAQIVTAQIAVNQVTNAVLAQMAANTVKANATAALADPQDLAVGTNTVLGRVAGNIVAAQLVTAQIAVNQVTNAVLAQMAALTVKANATNALANAADLAAGSDDTVLRRTASTLNFGQLTAGMFPAAIIPLSSLAAQAANTVVANATAGVASPTAFAVGTNTVLGRVAGNIVAAQVVNAQVVGGGLGTVKGVALGGVAGTLADLTGLEVGELARFGNDEIFSLAPGTHTLTLANTTNIVFIRLSAPGTVIIDSIVHGSSNSGAEILLVRDSVGSAGSVILDDTNIDVNSVWTPSAISYELNTANDNTFLRHNGFRWYVADRLQPNSGFALMASNTIKANATAGSAQPTDFAIGTNTVLGRVAGNIVAAQAVNAQITGGTLGTVKGVALGGVAGTLQDLTQTQQAEQLRFSTVVTDTTSSGSVATYSVAATTTAILVNTAATVEILGISIPAVAGQRIIFRRELTAPAAWTFRHNNAGAGLLQERLSLNLAQDVLLGDQQAIELEYNNNRWRQIGSTATSFQAANTVFANDTAAAAAPTAISIGTNTVLGRVAGNIVAAQLVDAQITNATISLPKLATQAANTVLANATAGAASPTAVAVGTNTVLGRVAGNIVAAQLVTAQIAVNQVTNAVLAQMAALTVKANATNALANAADLAAGSDDTVLRRTASTLNFGQLTAGMFPAAIIPLSSLATQAANTVVANATAGVASPTAVAVGTNTVLGRVAGNIVAAQIVNAQIDPAAAIALTKLAAWTEVEEAGAGPFNDYDPLGARHIMASNAAGVFTGVLAGSIGQVLVISHQGAGFTEIQHNSGSSTSGNRFFTGRLGVNIRIFDNEALVFYYLDVTAGVGTITNWLLVSPQPPFVTSASNVNGDVLTFDGTNWVTLNIGTNTVLGRVAGNVIAAQVATAQIADAAVTLAKIQNIDSLSILARIVNSNGPPQELSSPGPFAVPYDDGAGNLVFALLVTGNYGNGTVTLPKLATQAANTVVANATAGVASPTAVAVGTNTVLGRVAGNIVAAQLVDAQITNATISLPKLATAAANTVIANATAGAASPTAVAVGTNTVLGRVAGNIVAAQVVNAQITGGSLATLKGVAINGVAGTLQDITQTQLSDMFRAIGTVTDTLAPGTVNDYVVAETTKLLRIAINADGDLEITGFALGSSNTGGWIRLFNQSTSVVRRIVLRHATGSSAGNQLILPGNTDFILDRFADAVDLQYIGGRWQVIQKLLTATQIPDGIITLPKLSTQAANTVVANATAGTASPTAVAVGTNTVLGRVAGNIVAAQLVDAQITNATISLPKLATAAANTVIANATAGAASPTAVAVGTNTVLGRVAGDIVADGLLPHQLSNGGVTANTVSFTIGPFTMTATGAAADDFIIINATAFRAFQILRMVPIVTAGVALGTLQARNATGGGGAAVSSTFDATAASDAPAITANLGSFGSIAAGGTLVVRRSSGNITGVVAFECIPQ